MKSHFRSSLIALMVLFSLTLPQPSSAGVLGTEEAKNWSGLIVGGSLNVLGVAWIVAGCLDAPGLPGCKFPQCGDLGCCCARAVGGAIVFGMGVVADIIGGIILDDHNVKPGFPVLNQEQGQVLGFSESELSFYNRELDQLNGTLEFCGQSVQGSSDPLNQGRECWKERKTELSPETVSAAEKLAIQIQNAYARAQTN